jgi:beta-lactamase class A
MLKSLQRYLTIAVLFLSGTYLLYQGFLFSQARSLLPQGVSIAGLDVSGLSREEATALLDEHYLAPLVVFHLQERVEIMPQDVGYQLDTEGMLRQAEKQRDQREIWRRYLEFLFGRTLDRVEIGLQATHDRAALLERLRMISTILDKPARSPQLLSASAEVEFGEDGYVTDLEGSLPDVEAALYRPDNREAQLRVASQQAPSLDMSFLAENIKKQLEAFDGIGSVFVLDLQTGEEFSINADVAMSGLSIVKIAILLETYRKLDFEPSPDQSKLIRETAVFSGDYSANLLLDVVAGQDNAYLGVDILTESMQRLGLVNTFIVTPYEEPSRAGKATLATPANSRTDVSTNPDVAMQSTAEDIGTLLSMIYYCTKSGGTLLAVYPDQLKPEECQAILDVLELNTEGNLIRFGVPETVPVPHKHGWATNTHGDAGIVFSPGGAYVLVEYLSQPLTDWLVVEVSFPILREISWATYNYFNPQNPNPESPLQRAEREAAALAAEATAEPTATVTDEGSGS